MGVEKGTGMKVSSALAGLLLSLMAGSALAREAPPPQAPAELQALAGCWRGTGEVMGKPVTIALSAKPIALGAMFLVEAESQATADPADRYAAHLVFGGRAAKKDDPATLSGFWIDSFGGDYTATGVGAPRKDGFDIAYAYPDASFINRWTALGGRLEWTIVAKSGSAPEEAFAHYVLTRAKCSRAGG
jgi:hypothetical protein